MTDLRKTLETMVPCALVFACVTGANTKGEDA